MTQNLTIFRDFDFIFNIMILFHNSDFIAMTYNKSYNIGSISPYLLLSL